MSPTSSSFDPDVWYRPGDPAMSLIGTQSTLARWRSDHRGPSFSKVGRGQGSRILYSGAVLNSWLHGQDKKVPVAA